MSETEQEKNQVTVSLPSDDERSFLFMVAVSSIVLSIIPALVLMTIRKELSDIGKAFLLKTLNFELVIILFGVCVGFVPIFGKLLSFCFFLFNFFTCVRAANAINQKKEFEYPITLNFIQSN